MSGLLHRPRPDRPNNRLLSPAVNHFADLRASLADSPPSSLSPDRPRSHPHDHQNGRLHNPATNPHHALHSSKVFNPAARIADNPRYSLWFSGLPRSQVANLAVSLLLNLVVNRLCNQLPSQLDSPADSPLSSQSSNLVQDRLSSQPLSLPHRHLWSHLRDLPRSPQCSRPRSRLHSPRQARLCSRLLCPLRSPFSAHIPLTMSTRHCRLWRRQGLLPPGQLCALQ